MIFNSNSLETKLYISLLLLGIYFYSSGTVSEKKNKIKTIKGTEILKKDIDKYVLTYLDSAEIPGLSIVIINDAKIAYKGAFGFKNVNVQEKITHKTLFEVASLSKPVFACFVMKQVEKGLIDLDKPLYQYLPYDDIAYDERYKLITGRMALCHATGFPNWREDSLKILFTPGTEYGYSGEGYHYLRDVMAEILEVDGVGLDSIFQREIVQPLGITHMGFTWNEDFKKYKAFGHIKGEPTDNGSQGEPERFGAAGGLHSTAIGYAKFLIALMNKKLITAQTWNSMLKEEIDMPIVPDLGHRSLLFPIKKVTDGTRFSHTGNNGDFQSFARFYKDKDYGIVILCNGDNLFSSGLVDNFLSFLQEQ